MDDGPGVHVGEDLTESRMTMVAVESVARPVVGRGGPGPGRVKRLVLLAQVREAVPLPLLSHPLLSLVTWKAPSSANRTVPALRRVPAPVLPRQCHVALTRMGMGVRFQVGTSRRAVGGRRVGPGGPRSGLTGVEVKLMFKLVVGLVRVPQRVVNRLDEPIIPDVFTAVKQVVGGSDLRGRRPDALSSLTESEIAAYDRARQHFDGVAVARLEGHRCHGCHLDLSPAEMDVVKAVPVDAMPECPQCGRYLVR